MIVGLDILVSFLQDCKHNVGLDGQGSGIGRPCTWLTSGSAAGINDDD